MYITSLKPDEGLEVPGAAEVTILSVRGCHVRVGVTTDPSVSIRRFKLPPDSSASPPESPIDPTGADITRDLSKGSDQ